MAQMRLLGGLALLSMLVASAWAQGKPSKMGIWIPLYVDPSKDTEYINLIKSVEKDKCLMDSFHGTVLTGPNSGPPNAKDAWEGPFYRNRFKIVADTTQWQAFGYVTTRYMKRPVEEVLADIDKWLAPGTAGYGDQVQGIWVDNVVSDLGTTNAAARDYYAKIAQYIKSYGKLVALNPGSNVVACDFIRASKIDFLNNFEDYYDVWMQTPKDRTLDCPCKDDTVCMASIHKYPSKIKNKAVSESDLADTMRMMSARGYGAMFITERTVPEHYLQLPTFWPQEVAAACSVNINQGNMNSAQGRRLLRAEP